MLFFLLSCSQQVDQSVRPKIRHYVEPGGTELILESYNLGKKTRFSPDHPCLDCDVKATKLINGKEIYSIVYHIDEFGFRTTSASTFPGKTKHALLIDGSMAFGEGLDDQHSLIDQINRRSAVYHAYDIGFLGNGPQHNWVTFKNQSLKNVVAENTGLAILISHDQDIRRFVVSTDHLIYASQFPNVVETSPGVFEQRGTIETQGTFLQRLLVKTCVPLMFCRTQMTKAFSFPTEREVEKAAHVYADIERMYREQFQVETVVILWTGSDTILEKLKKYSHLKIVKVDYERLDANHPSNKGATQIVDKLFAEKILY